ncbi:hypothetical protein FZ983_32200 [Azospirillum sp. B21]|uniref:hypothetical protein n=1 Tax=Azospirillum sp. B21 TaxID=2607496 RepID=UPI0011EC14DF|nr:hypothetical protein [Azospirillum sp. B21]KAA0572234.1 hypothetical protein FZ983_32200 [Azospirillum sp. B21]
MNPDARAILSALPAAGHDPADVASVAAKAGRPNWIASNAIACLLIVEPGSVEAVIPAGRKKMGPLYRRGPRADGLLAAE